MSSVLARLARSRLTAPARRLAGKALGGRQRRVRILTGAGRGGVMELDLGREKAYWAGVYEPDVQAILAVELGPQSVFWDVGAHLGFFSVCARRLGAAAVAFEAAPENATRLRRHGELNGFDVVEAAVWRDAGGVRLERGPTPEQWAVHAGGDTRSVTLDETARASARPTLVKLDVEGAAGAVLEGATGIVAARQTTFVCELHGSEEEREVRRLLDGYELVSAGMPSRLVARPLRDF